MICWSLFDSTLMVDTVRLKLDITGHTRLINVTRSERLLFLSHIPARLQILPTTCHDIHGRCYLPPSPTDAGSSRECAGDLQLSSSVEVIKSRLDASG
jgi:hypothetical protein